MKNKYIQIAGVSAVINEDLGNVSGIISGHQSMNDEFIKSLEKVHGGNSEKFWMNVATDLMKTAETIIQKIESNK